MENISFRKFLKYNNIFFNFLKFWKQKITKTYQWNRIGKGNQIKQRKFDIWQHKNNFFNVKKMIWTQNYKKYKKLAKTKNNQNSHFTTKTRIFLTLKKHFSFTKLVTRLTEINWFAKLSKRIFKTHQIETTNKIGFLQQQNTKTKTKF